MMKLNKFLLLLLSFNGLFAQMKTSATLENVTKSGFHRINLSAEIRAYSNRDLSDIRIFDSNNGEVPYFIASENREKQSIQMQPFAILSKTRVYKKNSTLIFEKPKQPIYQIVLTISNSDAVKSFSLSGSNDQNEWFGIINKGRLDNLSDIQKSAVSKIITIPNTTYKFLKIEFDDTKTLPINILDIGSITQNISSPNAELESIKVKTIQTTEEQATKSTIIKIAFDKPQHLDQLSFLISKPEFYNRKASIYKYRKIKYKKKFINEKEYITAFHLNSKASNAVPLSEFFEKEFYIEINNEDNKPLTIEKLSFLQEQIAIIADFDANENYTIKTGNPKLEAPSYDLENFKSEISNELPQLKILKTIHEESQNTVKSPISIWQKPWFMWMCIGVGAIALFYFSANLVKDMKKNGR